MKTSVIRARIDQRIHPAAVVENSDRAITAGGNSKNTRSSAITRLWFTCVADAQRSAPARESRRSISARQYHESPTQLAAPTRRPAKSRRCCFTAVRHARHAGAESWKAFFRRTHRWAQSWSNAAGNGATLKIRVASGPSGPCAGGRSETMAARKLALVRQRMLLAQVRARNFHDQAVACTGSGFVHARQAAKPAVRQTFRMIGDSINTAR